MVRGLFQPMHLLIILAIALIVVGPGKLPELGKMLVKSIKDFKKAIAGGEKVPLQQLPKNRPLKTNRQRRGNLLQQ